MFDVDGIWLWLMRPDGSGGHSGADWRKQFSMAGAADWSPDASKVALEIHLLDGSSRLGIADFDSTSGTVV